MPNMISIKVGTIEVQAELNNTSTAKSLLRILPMRPTITGNTGGNSGKKTLKLLNGLEGWQARPPEPTKVRADSGLS